MNKCKVLLLFKISEVISPHPCLCKDDQCLFAGLQLAVVGREEAAQTRRTRAVSLRHSSLRYLHLLARSLHIVDVLSPLLFRFSCPCWGQESDF